MKTTVFILWGGLLTGSVEAQRDLKELPPVDVASQMASFRLAPGLEIGLFAQEPLIAKPIQMAWDEKGRLWVASSAIYPHIKPGQTQADKIVILEDTDRDGKADKSTVFYEGLLIPTGILPGDGGAYVANSTELLFMKDTDGDGRADETRVLLSGFGTEDTHHILHSLKRGPDGCLYFAQSVYIHSRIETPYGVRELRGSGWWQYRPETGRLEVYSMGQVNPWGMVWDRWGQTFTTDGAFGEGINYTFPGATFLCLPNQLPRILKGLNPGQPKQAGLEIISGRHFPEDWQGQLITCDFRGHRVNRFAVTTEGSGYSSRQLEDVVSSTHGSFRPVDARMGPDGALYLADWYNPIIQHGEVDFHDERRDHEHGRIWRITAKGRGLSPAVDYSVPQVEGVIHLLKEPEDWVRIFAKQELKKRRVESLNDTVRAMLKIEGGNSHFRMECLALLQTASQLDPGSPLLSAAGDPDYEAYAVRAVGQQFREGKGGDAGPAMRAVLSESPRVRLEGVNALRLVGTAAAVEQACRVLDSPMDDNIDFALWLTCRELADVWLPEFRGGALTFQGNVAHIIFALKAADRPEAVGALLKLVEDGKVSGTGVRDALALLGAMGSEEDLTNLMSLVLRRESPPDLVAAGLDALGTAQQQRKTRPGEGFDRMLPLLASEDPVVRMSAVRLAGVWRLEGARTEVETLAASGSAAAMKALGDLGGPASAEFLKSLAGRKDNPTRQAAALAALAEVDAPGSAGLAAAFLSETAEASPAVEVFDAWLARKNGPELLAGALKGRKMSAEIAALGVRQAGTRGEEGKVLAAVLTEAGGLAAVGTGMSPGEMEAMMREVRERGDAARGEAVYRRQALLCQTCHAIGAVGGVVGPDLLSIGSSAPVDYIIDSLLEPSKKIKEGYATTVVNTKDGGVFSGFLVREDAREVLLRDAAGVVQSVPVAEIAGKQNVPVSLMAPGLTAGLRRDEFVDLVRFLSELGKEGTYKVQADGVVRRWRLPQVPADIGQIVNRGGLRALTVDQPGLSWVPVYATVGGELAMEEIPAVKLYQTSGRVVQGEIEVTTPGAVVLKFHDPAGLKVWLDDQEITVAAEVPLELTKGIHKVTVLADPVERRSPLRVEVQAAAGSPARVVPVGGV